MDTNAARPLLRSLVVAGGALALLAACSSGGGGTGPTTTTNTTAFSTIPIQTTTTPPTVPGQGSGGAGSTVAGGGATGATYTVVSGDYFVGIANKLGVPLQALLDANGMTASSLITPGMKLKVPQTSSSTTTTKPGGTGGTATTTAASTGTTVPPTTTTLPGAGGTYTVVAGDFWNGIAQKLGVKVDDLTAFNDMTINTVIHPGDKLRVPPKT